MNKTITNPEFVKRMAVDSENITAVRNNFFKGEEISSKEIEDVISITPHHKEINWGPNRITMVPWSGIQNTHDAIKDTVNKNIEGDFVETGAWRGGMCIIAKSIYNDLKVDKKVFVVDSFEGLPKPDTKKYPDDKNDTHYLDENMKVSLESVKENFRKFNCLDDKVVFIKGWFKDTLPNASIAKISILRLDGDMYESTIDVLENLYHKLSIGGYCIIDDYHHPACKAAVKDFRAQNHITELIIKVDSDPLNEVHYWIKDKNISFVHRDYAKRGVVRAINDLVFFGKKCLRKIMSLLIKAR
jgi:O-methyltransferase